ncbi:hypothetical protein MRB53_038887 [Persea americana]|nr:hypothetical protein MRB53_038887 [Persea americana]
MPWSLWKRPAAGEKINYWKKPELETIEEGIARGFYFYFPNYPSENMTDGWGSDTWGNGPATSAGADTWNDGGAAGNWNDGGNTNDFTDNAQPAGDFGDAGFGDAGTGAGGSGGCLIAVKKVC